MDSPLPTRPPPHIMHPLPYPPARRHLTYHLAARALLSQPGTPAYQSDNRVFERGGDYGIVAPGHAQARSAHDTYAPHCRWAGLPNLSHVSWRKSPADHINDTDMYYDCNGGHHTERF